MKRWVRRLGLAAAFAVTCAAALEALLRIAAPIPLNSPRFRTSARYCTELWPSNDGFITTVDFRHAFRTDERGWRRSGAQSPGSAPAPRSVAVIGDSMVFGEGVADDETFVARLPAALAERGAGRWDAWNLGIGGHGTAQHLARLEDLMTSGRRPDVALVTFFANDPRDDRECRPFELAADGTSLARVVPAYFAHPPPKRIQWLAEQPAYRWITSRSQLLGRIRLKLARTEDRRHGTDTSVPPERRPGGNALDEPLTPDALRLLTSLYRRLASDAREWSLPLGLVLVPHKGCFEAGSRAACDAKLDTVARVAAEAGLAVLDLRPAFAARSIETDYYPHDLHWTAAGHAAATAPIADFIVRLEARTGGSERPST
ncbi:MAG: GDSL-type esterase/lipase family protein [bacterium]